MEKRCPQQVSQWIGGLGNADCWKRYAKVVLNEGLDGFTIANISQDSLIKLGFHSLHAEAIVKQRDQLLLPSPPPPPPPAAAANNDDVPHCSAHNRPFEEYCVQDEQLVCATCMCSSHHAHHCELINDVFVKQKANIESLLNEANERSKEWVKAADHLSTMKKQSQINNDRVVTEIEIFFIAVEKKIRERKENLQGELKRVMEEKVKILTKQEEELRNAVKELEKVGGSMKQCLETKSAVECLQLKQEIMLHLGDENRQGKRRRREAGERGGGGVRCEPDCGVDTDFVGDANAIGEMIDGLGELKSEVRGTLSNTDKAVASVRGRGGNGDEREESRGRFDQANDDDSEGAKGFAMLVKGSPKIITQPPSQVLPPPRFLSQYCSRHLTLSQTDSVVTKSRGGGRWNAAVLADNGDYNNGVLSYRVKIPSRTGVMVGFASKAIKKNHNNNSTCGFYFYTNDGNLFSQRRDTKLWGPSCYNGPTVIKCVLDTVKHEIWFGVNGDPKLAFENVPPDITHLALNFHTLDSSVQLLESNEY